MKNFLFIILVVVAAVLLWAIRAEAYSSGMVFLLSLVATALSAYLIADYFLKIEKQSLKDNLHISQKENQALKERIDLLQTQLNTTTPYAEIEQFEQRVALLADEKNKLDGLSRAQTAEIANLKEKLESLQQSHAKLQEDATIWTETAHAQTVVLQEKIASKKLKNQALIDENTALNNQNAALIAELDAKIGENIAIVSEGNENTVEVRNPDSFGEGGDLELSLDNSIATGRDLAITELEIDDEDDAAAEDYGTSDNLQAIDGIGEKVATVLSDVGISTWETLSMTSPERLRVVLDNAGLQNIYPESWPEQARLLVHREFSKLKKYKAHIAGQI